MTSPSEKSSGRADIQEWSGGVEMRVTACEAWTDGASRKVSTDWGQHEH
jgi:hypothetical protein